MCQGCNQYMCLGTEAFRENTDFVIALVFLFFDSGLYFMLGLYLEKVSLRTWGVRKHPCFCLGWIPAFFEDCCFLCCSENEVYMFCSRWMERIRICRKCCGCFIIKKRRKKKKERKRRQDINKNNNVIIADQEREAKREKRISKKKKKWMITEDEDEDVSKTRDGILGGTVGKDDVGILVRGLVKQFGRGKRKNIAVKGAFLSVQKKECFGLLGPNGAGKTTLIRILSGIFAPNRGSAFLGGHDIRSSMEQIREKIGLCPQFTIYWPELTPSEHLLFYSRLKGVPLYDEEHHVSEILEKVGLKSPLKRFLDLHTHHHHHNIRTPSKQNNNNHSSDDINYDENDKLVGNSSSSSEYHDHGEYSLDEEEQISKFRLFCFGFVNRLFRLLIPFGEKTVKQMSGGMRRRLAIGISLCGDPDIILLDEPTTGLDTLNRREIWDVILKEKNGRCVILTTHSMEEADVLSDRIAIMSHGRVVAIGSSLHLKNKFGNGYSLHVKTSSSSSVGKIMEFIENSFSNFCRLKLIKKFGEKISYQLLPPVISVEQQQQQQLRISEVFERLELEKERLRIVDFELNQTTLEDVFLNVVRMDEERIISRESSEKQQKTNWKELGFVVEEEEKEEKDDDEEEEEGGVSDSDTESNTSQERSSEHTQEEEENIGEKEPDNIIKKICGYFQLLFCSEFCCFILCCRSLCFETPLQTLFLLHKNCILSFRSWKSSCIQVFISPFFCCVAIFLVFVIIEEDRPDYFVHPDIHKIDTSSLQPCKSWGVYDTGDDDGGECLILAYAHNNNRFAMDVMDDVVGRYDLLEGEDYEVFITTEELENYLSENMNKTQTAVSFSSETKNLLTSENITIYTLYFNGTKDMDNQVIPFKIIIDNSILRISHQWSGSESDGATNIFVDQQEFPHIPSYGNINGQRIVFSYTGPIFFSLLTSILFIVSLYRLTMEKEKGLRMGLEMIGMKRSSYICSWLINFTVFGICMSLMTMLSGYIFQFDPFLYSNPVFMFILFFLFDLSLIFFAFAVSTIITKTKSALVVGFMILAISFILNIYIASGSFVYLLLSLEDGYAIIPLLFEIFYPPFNFGKAFSDILIKTMKVYDMEENQFVPNDGFWGFTDLFEEGQTVVFESVDVAIQRPIYSYLFLILNILVFTVIFFYLDSVIVTGRSVCFCCSPFFLTCGCCNPCKNQCCSCRHPKKVSTRTNKLPRRKINDLDDDLKREYFACRDTSQSHPLRIIGLKKTYRPPLLILGRRTKAVKGVDLHFKHHEVIGLLGPNGAGKSTLVQSCAGVTSVSDGEIYVKEKNRRLYDTKIRKHMGVALQHNILWDDLTAYEHLRLFSQIKGLVSPCAWRKQVKMRLKEVSLYDVRNDLSHTFSGGMKRRLSVAMGYIGSPELVLLDEPSTGLDPFSKREVWKLIKEKSQNKECSTLFTTHSMEECDALSHQIAIMKDGRVMCIGDSMYLKRKYGAGYVLKVSCWKDHLLDDFVRFLKSLFPHGKIQKDGGSQYKVLIDPKYTQELIHGLKRIEDNIICVEDKEEGRKETRVFEEEYSEDSDVSEKEIISSDGEEGEEVIKISSSGKDSDTEEAKIRIVVVEQKNNNFVAPKNRLVKNFGFIFVCHERQSQDRWVGCASSCIFPSSKS